MGDQAQLTASVILNAQVERSHGNVLHQWNEPVGGHLGHGDRRGVVSLCMQAWRWRGILSCLHPLGHTLESPLKKVNLHLKFNKELVDNRGNVYLL